MKKSMSPKTHGKILIYIYILQVERMNFGGLEEIKIKKGSNKFDPLYCHHQLDFFAYYTKLNAIDGAWLACANKDVDTCCKIDS